MCAQADRARTEAEAATEAKAAHRLSAREAKLELEHKLSTALLRMNPCQAIEEWLRIA